MTKVKICGITNLQDAQLAVDLGADMLGFNFFKGSKRYVSEEFARDLSLEIPSSVKKVGVFVNSSIDEILRHSSVARLDKVQLHGDESIAFESELRSKTKLETIKAVRIDKNFDVFDAMNFDSDILLDKFEPGDYGGTGQTFDWKIAQDLWTMVPCVYLAGGLNPDNVAEAIRTVRPYAVDVASGVESSPGKKDPKKLEAFIRNAKNA